MKHLPGQDFSILQRYMEKVKSWKVEAFSPIKRYFEVKISRGHHMHKYDTFHIEKCLLSGMNGNYELWCIHLYTKPPDSFLGMLIGSSHPQTSEY